MYIIHTNPKRKKGRRGKKAAWTKFEAKEIGFASSMIEHNRKNAVYWS